MALNYFSYGHPLVKIRSFFSWRARKKMFNLFMDKASPQCNELVLDLGVTPDSILIESNFFEQLYPYRNNIIAASIEDASNLEDQFPGVRFQIIDGKTLPFNERQFDLVFCSAVLEHVGTMQDQREFLSEIARVSDRFFVTTPNRWFPIDFHTMLPLVHWLPRQWHQKVLRSVGQDFLSKTENLNLIGEKEIAQLMPSNFQFEILRNRLFGITSNLIVYATRI